MSDTGAVETPVSSEPASPIDYEALPDDPHYVPPGSERESDSLASPFLKNIVDDNERKIVEKYVRDWDAGVTKKLQSVHEQYKPYKEAGLTPEQAVIAAQVLKTLDENPRAVYDILHEQFGKQVADAMVQEPQEVDDPYSELPPAVAAEIKQMKELVALMANNQMQEVTAKQQQQEDQLLDDYLVQMHSKHGDFDEDYVMGKVMAGKSWEEAIKEYDSLMNKLTGTVRKAPPVLGGGGAIPAGKIPPSKLSKEETQKFIADQLARAAQE